MCQDYLNISLAQPVNMNHLGRQVEGARMEVVKVRENQPLLKGGKIALVRFQGSMECQVIFVNEQRNIVKTGVNLLQIFFQLYPHFLFQYFFRWHK